MRVRISSEALAAMRAHAAEEPDREVCGLLLGDGDQIAAILRTNNIAADPRHRFEVEPRALIAAYRAERSGGPKLLGCYHSHPNGTADPSETDRACSAGDGQLWLIVARGKVGGWRAEPKGFQQIELIVS